MATPAKQSVVFVVDDEHALADTLSLMLRDAGFYVATFYDGFEVLHRIHESPPDVVVTDFAMPRVNGMELTLWLKQHYPACRIVMMSGNSALPWMDHGDPNFTFLSKPVPAEKLISIVKGEHL